MGVIKGTDSQVCGWGGGEAWARTSMQFSGWRRMPARMTSRRPTGRWPSDFTLTRTRRRTLRRSSRRLLRLTRCSVTPIRGLPMTDTARRGSEEVEVEVPDPLLPTRMHSTSSEPSLHEEIHSRETPLVRIPSQGFSKASMDGQATQASTYTTEGPEASLTPSSLGGWVLPAVVLVLVLVASSETSEPPQTVLSVEKPFQSQ